MTIIIIIITIIIITIIIIIVVVIIAFIIFIITLIIKIDKIFDTYADATFPSIPGILDNDDLKVNGLWCCTLGVYQFLYVGLFAALFITNYFNEANVLYLAPYTPNHSKYCSSASIAVTSTYWIDENGYFEGIRKQSIKDSNN